MTTHDESDDMPQWLETDAHKGGGVMGRRRGSGAPRELLAERAARIIYERQSRWEGVAWVDSWDDLPSHTKDRYRVIAREVVTMVEAAS